jgi:hypothetical protein
MYEGSMVGAGINVFAVWNYCIAKNRLGIIELNPKLLAFILGGTEQQIVDAIDVLCAPDTRSRCKDENGARLIREGEYQCRMVNWAKYDGIRNAAGLREYNRTKQREHREKVKAKADASGYAEVHGSRSRNGDRPMDEGDATF